ncbi:hypothetical protein L1987_34472 [Smallanthus sonchifolius]|uniref:Uncharacterized protein n=1 Tax=Smallanthus sonchifolius TaxID=185202 RepID=A0ACB9HWI1_9ASTR|nr:hypothetical protein L1987_34472 [Smallanthus sonchifolius]
MLLRRRVESMEIDFKRRILKMLILEKGEVPQVELMLARPMSIQVWTRTGQLHIELVSPLPLNNVKVRVLSWIWVGGKLGRCMAVGTQPWLGLIAGCVHRAGGCKSSNLGHNTADADAQGNQDAKILSPELVTSLKQISERVVQTSLTNSIYYNAHTFAPTETGKLYAFGAGNKGHLGEELLANQK